MSVQSLKIKKIRRNLGTYTINTVDLNHCKGSDGWLVKIME